MTIPPTIFQTTPAETYASARPKIASGDLVLFSGAEFSSRAIEWGTRSPYSHVGIAVRLEIVDRLMLLQSIPGAGCCTVALSAIVQGAGLHQPPLNGRLVIARHDDFAAKATPAAVLAMSQFAVERFGAPYSSLEIVKIMTRIALGWLDIRLPARLQPDDEYICSEYVALCYQRLGIAIAWDGLGFIAPSDIAADPRVRPVAVIGTA